MTLGEYFKQEKLELDIVAEKAEESTYWDSVENFLRDNWDKDLLALSSKQHNWAQKILEDLVEQRIEGRL